MSLQFRFRFDFDRTDEIQSFGEGPGQSLEWYGLTTSCFAVQNPEGEWIYPKGNLIQDWDGGSIPAHSFLERFREGLAESWMRCGLWQHFWRALALAETGPGAPTSLDQLRDWAQSRSALTVPASEFEARVLEFLELVTTSMDDRFETVRRSGSSRQDFHLDFEILVIRDRTSGQESRKRQSPNFLTDLHILARD